MLYSRLSALMFAAIGLSCSTASAQLLPERLVPPQQFSIPSLPMTEQPAARRPAGADKLPAHLWTLPVGAFPGAPTSLSPEEQATLGRPVSELNLSVRARKCMNRLNITTIGDLVSRTGDELMEAKNFGVTSLNEVKEKITALGLKLRGD